LSEIVQMLTKIYCPILQNDQYIDLELVEYVESAETKYCAGWRDNLGKYTAVTFGMKSGNIIQVTMEKVKLEALMEARN